MPNPVVHFEIGCRDLAKTSKFYSQMFDWKMQPYGPASMIDTAAGESRNINGHINSLGHEPHNYVLVYVQVEDLNAYLKRAESLGGKMLVPPTPVPGMGSFAWLADPEGNKIGLWKPERSA